MARLIERLKQIADEGDFVELPLELQGGDQQKGSSVPVRASGEGPPRLIKEKCHALAEDPFPGQGGDKELLHLEFKLYRLLVGRSFSVFY